MEHTPKPVLQTPVQPIWLKAAAWFMVCCAGLNHFAYVTADPDLWGHIRFGADTWRHGFLESADPYAYTTAHTTWINHEWLSELILFGLYKIGGDASLLAFKLLIGIALLIIIMQICRVRPYHPIILAVIALPAVISIAPGFMLRPQLASYLLFGGYVFVFHLYFHSGKNRLWLLPLLMVCWVNLHGGFLMGIALLGWVIGWQSLAVLLRIESGPPLKPLWVTGIAVGLASCINPYGYKLHLFLYYSLKTERAISEWEPVTILDNSFLTFKLLAALFLLAAVLGREKRLHWEIAGLVLLLYAAIRHQRHIPFYAIMVVPYLVYQGSRLATVIRTVNPRFVLSRGSQVILAVAFGLIGIHQAAAGIGKNIQTGWRIVVNPDAYPVAAVSFMRQNNFQGNLQLPFEWGEYAIWHLYPNCRVSIDGRFRTTYPETVIQDHFQARANPGLTLTLAEKYAADIILTKQKAAMQAVINRYDSDWLYVYSDPVAIIFLRNNHRNAKLLAAFKNKEWRYPQKAPSAFFP